MQLFSTEECDIQLLVLSLHLFVLRTIHFKYILFYYLFTFTVYLTNIHYSEREELQSVLAVSHSNHRKHRACFTWVNMYLDTFTIHHCVLVSDEIMCPFQKYEQQVFEPKIYFEFGVHCYHEILSTLTFLFRLVACIAPSLCSCMCEVHNRSTE